MTTLRFQYSGSYTDPTAHHFGAGKWMPEEECRAAITKMLQDPKIRADSIRIVVQQKKIRWLHLKDGPVDGIFPEIPKAIAREKAIQAILDTPGLPSRVWIDAKSAVKRGVPESLAEARLLVATLEKIHALGPENVK
jgi:hypothetical protein